MSDSIEDLLAASAEWLCLAEESQMEGAYDDCTAATGIADTYTRLAETRMRYDKVKPPAEPTTDLTKPNLDGDTKIVLHKLEERAKRAKWYAVLAWTEGQITSHQKAGRVAAYNLVIDWIKEELGTNNL